MPFFRDGASAIGPSEQDQASFASRWTKEYSCLVVPAAAAVRGATLEHELNSIWYLSEASLVLCWILTCGQLACSLKR